MSGVFLKNFRKTYAANEKIRTFVPQFQTDCIMADLSVIVSEIEQKLRKLIDEKSRLAIENKRLTAENEALRAENAAQHRAVEELENTINKSTIVNALDNEGEIEEARKLIKALVREIDGCVSILNSKE